MLVGLFLLGFLALRSLFRTFALVVADSA